MTPEKFKLARDMKKLENIMRRVVRDIRQANDNTPLLKLGPGGRYTTEIHGKDGALLSPPGGTVSSRGERCPPFVRSEP